MSPISSTSGTNSIFNLYGIKNNGIGGLASGLDTDQLVEALTAGTRSKIAQQSQKKTLLQWQQTAYRGVATTLRAFQSNRLKATGGTNYIGFNAFFNTYKGTSTSGKVTMKESATSASGSVKIDKILQLASAEKLTTETNKGIVGGKFDINNVNLDTKLYISVDDGTTRTVDLSSLNGTWKNDLSQAVLDDPVKLAKALGDKIQALVDTAVGTRTKVGSDGKPIPAMVDNPIADSTHPDFDSDAPKFIPAVDSKGKPVYEQESIVNVAITPDLLGTGNNNSLRISADSNKVKIEANNNTFGLKKGDSNRIDTSKSVADIFGITGTIKIAINRKVLDSGKVEGEIEINGSDSIATMMSKISNSTAGVRMTYSNVTGEFTMTADNTGAGSNIVFGEDSKGLLDAIFGSEGTGNGHTRTAGTNAEIVVNGQVLSQATNTFDVGGIVFDVNDVTKDSDDPIIISSTHDVDGLVDKIKGFVDEYNVIIETLNSLIYESKSTIGDYPPLSDEQKATMTDEQIKTWETEAKKGLLRNDSVLRGIVSEMRATMNKKVESVGLSLYDIGISPQSYADSSGSVNGFNYSKAGRLVIDEKGEQRLRAAIANNPDGVRMLFTDQEDGIAVSLSKVMDNAASTDRSYNNADITRYTRKGSLVRLAGAEGLTGDDNITITSRIDYIDNYVSSLKTRLEKEYSRHWARFSALETAISRMNAQTSALTQFSSN